MMKRIYEDNYEPLLACINQALDNVYNMTDALDNMGSDYKKIPLQNAAEEWEKLRTAFMAHEDLTPYQEGQVLLCATQTLENFKNRKRQILKAIQMMEPLVKNITFAQKQS